MQDAQGEVIEAEFSVDGAVSGALNIITHHEGHSELGGSSADRWVNCPGSIFLLRQVPKQEAGEAAAQGTLAHSMLETKLGAFLENRLHGTPYAKTVEPIRTDDDEMWDLTDDALTLIWENVLEESITDKGWGIEDKFFIDEQLQMGGFVDFYVIYIDDRGKRVACLVDFKYGFHPVSVEKNYQLAFYSVALRKFIQSHDKDIDKVRCVIIQPRADNDNYQETSYTAKQLDTWEKKFFKAADQIYVKQKPKFKTGDHCKWCQAQAVCVAKQKEVSAEMDLIMIDPENTKLPEVAMVPDELIVQVLEKEDKILSFLKAVRSYAMERARLGTSLPGWKLVEGKSRRQWKKNDEAEIAKALKENGVLEPFNQKLKGLGEMEREVANILGIPKKEASEFITQFCDMSTPSLTLVPESDPRVPVKNLLNMLAEGDD